MTVDSGRKLFIGGRLRRLRLELGLSQTRLAEALGISPSYANLMERNQRPVTAQVLIRLAEAYDVDVAALASSEDDRSLAEIGEIAGDPLFRDLQIPPQELRDFVESCPSVADVLRRLYQAYQQTRRDPADGTTAVGGGHRDPIEAVRDAIEAARNHFPALDEAAEQLSAELAETGLALPPALAVRLQARHGVRLRLLPARRHGGDAAPLRPPPPPVAAQRDAVAAGPHLPCRSSSSRPSSIRRRSMPRLRKPGSRMRRRGA